MEAFLANKSSYEKPTSSGNFSHPFAGSTVGSRPTNKSSCIIIIIIIIIGIIIIIVVVVVVVVVTIIIIIIIIIIVSLCQLYNSTKLFTGEMAKQFS